MMNSATRVKRVLHVLENMLIRLISRYFVKIREKSYSMLIVLYDSFEAVGYLKLLETLVIDNYIIIS